MSARLVGVAVWAHKDRKQYAQSVKDAIELWAFKEGDETLDVQAEPPVAKRSGGPPQDEEGGGLGGTCRWDTDERRARDAFVRVVVSGPLAASIRAEHVCPFCLYYDIAGSEVERNIEFRGRATREYEDKELRERLLLGSVNNGWLEAAALAHNREMHSANGNIDTIHDNVPDRTTISRFAHDMFWDGATIQEKFGRGDGSAFYQLQREMPRVYFARHAQRGNQSFTNAGTLHQLLAKRRRYEELTGEEQGRGEVCSGDEEESGVGGGSGRWTPPT